MGEGLMTITPVMGTALISSYKLSHQRKGAVLLIQDDLFKTTPTKALVSLRTPTAIDWIHSDLALSREISNKAELNYPESSNASDLMREYIEAHRANVDPQWVSSTVEANAL